MIMRFHDLNVEQSRLSIYFSLLVNHLKFHTCQGHKLSRLKHRSQGKTFLKIIKKFSLLSPLSSLLYFFSLLSPFFLTFLFPPLFSLKNCNFNFYPCEDCWHHKLMRRHAEKKREIVGTRERNREGGERETLIPLL